MTDSVLTDSCQSNNIFRLTSITLLFQWIICFGDQAFAQTYGPIDLCGNNRHDDTNIALEPGSHVRFDLNLNDVSYLAAVGCEVTVQTARQGDGLLLSYERFDFAGSNTAAVFHGPDCGIMQLKTWHGDKHYTSTCLGTGLERAPAMTTFSPLGIVRFQLIATADLVSNDLSTRRLMNFSVIVTASTKASTTVDCPSGCCVQPYVSRCPQLDQCIDSKSMCSGLPICGPQGSEPFNDGLECNETMPRLPTATMKGINLDRIEESGNVVADPRIMEANIMAPIWHPAADPTSYGNKRAEERQIFYSRVEMVCGVLSMAFFCLAGIAVFTCRSSRQPQSSSTSAFIDDSRRSSLDDLPPYVAVDPQQRPPVGQSETEANRSDTMQQTISIENETCATVVTPLKPCRSCSAGQVNANCPKCSAHPVAPPSYDSLYPHPSQ